MNDELLNYLSIVEANLKDINPIERAKVIIEVENQVKESTLKYPEKTIHQILEDLGTPDHLANHYRLQKGLKTFKEKKPFSFLRFLLSLIIFFTLFMTTLTLVAIWKFSPVFEVNEKENRVVILGGLIELDGKSGKTKIMNSYQYLDNQYTNSFEGSIDIIDNEFEELVVNFKSGTLIFNAVNSQILSWNCQLDSPPKEEYINKSNEIIELDFETLKGVSCTISIPSNMKVTADGHDARVEVNEPLSDIYVEIKYGTVVFTPNPETDYKYEVNVDAGEKARFINSENEDAIEINLTVKEGNILKGNK